MAGMQFHFAEWLPEKGIRVDAPVGQMDTVLRNTNQSSCGNIM